MPVEVSVGAERPPGEARARSTRRRWGATAAVALVLALLAALLGPRITARLRPAEPSGLLLASGRIEGRITTLTPKTAAWVVALHADEGQAVGQGQLLATLDDEAQRERLRAAGAHVDGLTQKITASNRQLGITERHSALDVDHAAAALREADARLRRARASAAQAQREAQRAAVLVAKELIAPQEAERTRLAADVAEHSVGEAQEALARAEQQLALARIGVQQVDVLRAERDALVQQRGQAEAQLAEQRSHVADFAVKSPIDGRILTRTVERGERVEAGRALFTLVDLDRLYVKIYLPEPSIGKIALGQEARVYVDAYPGRAFPARVSRVGQEAEFTPKNVETREERVKLVFAVEVALAENPGGILKPGMPVDAAIRWQPDAPWK